jgi:DNA-binding response OmpR family regulator
MAEIHVTGVPPGQAAETLAYGPFQLDPCTRRLGCGARSTRLSRREFSLMHHLMRNAGSVCTRSELLQEVWGYDFDPGTNVVDVTIGRLRGKIHGLRIETVRTVGYALKPA